MNYEEKYKEALEKARKELNTCGSQDCDAARQIFRLFPELAESKDEKVRKALIDFFGKGAKYGGQTNGVYDKDILAWLEKQGGTSPVLSNSSNIGKDEQKPVEGNKGNVGGISSNWSEEDKGIIEEVVSYLINYSNIVESKEDADRIEYLIDKIQDICPHHKQEWSEEDEQHIDSLLKRLDALCRNKFERTRFAISEDRDWLKSLRPQNRWKPSDEQISLLQAIINEPNNAASESCQIVLKDILEQLKKLKDG